MQKHPRSVIQPRPPKTQDTLRIPYFRTRKKITIAAVFGLRTGACTRYGDSMLDITAAKEGATRQPADQGDMRPRTDTAVDGGGGDSAS